MIDDIKASPLYLVLNLNAIGLISQGRQEFNLFLLARWGQQSMIVQGESTFELSWLASY
jgi:hypothetical protein